MAQKNYLLEEIVVMAKLDEDAVQTRKNTPYSKQVFSLKDLKGFGHQTAGDVIKHMPGLYLQGPLNLQRNVKMAGLDKEFQCILINGNRPFGGADRRDLKLDRIPIDMIERIEVIKNPPSSISADAVSGVINVILKKTADADLFNFDMNGGFSSNTKKMNGRIATNYSASFEDFSFLAGVSIHDYERESITEYTKFTSLGIGSENLDVTMISFNLDMNYKLSETANISFSPYITNYDELTILKETNTLNENLVYLDDRSNEDKLRLLQSYGLTFTNQFSPDFKIKTYTAFTANREDKYKDRITTSLNDVINKYEDEEQRVNDYLTSIDAIYFTNFLDLEVSINSGVKYSFNDRSVNRLVSQETSGLDNLTFSNESYGITEQIFSSFLELESSLSTNLSIITGLRYENTHDEVMAADIKGIKTYSSANPFFNLAYRFSGTDFFIKAIISKQLSRPPYQYIAPVVKRKNRKTEEGNFDLSPSTSLNYNISFENYFNRRSFISLSCFYKDLTDVIEQYYVGDDPLNNDNPIFRAINISEAKVYGVDLELKLMLDYLIDNLSFYSNASLLGSVLTDPWTGNERRLKDQPEYILNAELIYQDPLSGIDISLGINHIGQRIDPESATIELVQKPFTQFDIQVKYYINDTYNIYANWQNIFNEHAHYTQGSENRFVNFGTTLKLGAAINL